MQTIKWQWKKFKKAYFVLGFFITFSVLSFAQETEKEYILKMIRLAEERRVINMFEVYKIYSTLNHKEQMDVWFNKIEETANNTGNILALQIVFNITKKFPHKGFQVAISEMREQEKQNMIDPPPPPLFDREGQIDQTVLADRSARGLSQSKIDTSSSLYALMDKGAMIRLRSEGRIERLVEKIKAPLPDNLCQRGFSD